MEGFDLNRKDWNLWVEKHALSDMSKSYTCTRMTSSKEDTY